MTIESDIDSIKEAIRAGRFANEASVAQGIVLRLLNSLGWPCYDTEIIWPEYSLQGRRVDFALCHPPKKPVAFVEVKQPGQADGAERQLFEYAFHAGIPLAILTNGQEWSFFLPAEQGNYSERRVYKPDLLERTTPESAERLRRYLDHGALTRGEALINARSDYQSITRQRQIENQLPEAWRRIVADADDSLVQLLADRVEILCGFKPEPDAVVAFLRKIPMARPELGSGTLPVPVRPGGAEVSFGLRPQPSQPTGTPPVSPPAKADHGGVATGFTLDGAFVATRTAMAALRETMQAFQRRDGSFFDRFASLPKHGRSRRYLARTPEELFPGRPDLSAEYAEHLGGGWYLGGNLSSRSIRSIIQMACDVAGVPFGSRYILHLSE